MSSPAATLATSLLPRRPRVTLVVARSVALALVSGRARTTVACHRLDELAPASTGQSA